jgi:hypothetical protein
MFIRSKSVATLCQSRVTTSRLIRYFLLSLEDVQSMPVIVELYSLIYIRQNESRIAAPDHESSGPQGPLQSNM